MRKVGFVLAVVCTAGLVIPFQSASAEQSPALQLDLRQAIKNSLNPIRRLSHARPIRSTGTAVMILKADLVTVNFGISSLGENAGSAIGALSRQKDELIDAAKDLGVEVVNNSSTSLNVRSRRARSSFKKDNEPKKTFNGTMSVILTFKADNDILAQIGKIAGDRVTSVRSMQFSFSQSEWDKQISGLKKRALDMARSKAVEQATQQGRELKNVVRSNVNTPRHSRHNRQQSIVVSVTARVSYNVE